MKGLLLSLTVVNRFYMGFKNGMVKFENNNLDFYHPNYTMPVLSLNDKELYEQFKKEWVYRKKICSFQQEHGVQND